MYEPAIRTTPANLRWPMTEHAWNELVEEVAQLRVDLAALAAGTPEDGVVDLPVFKAARRLDVLTAALHAAEKSQHADRAVIGRRVTLLEEDGGSFTFALVFPGDGDPARGLISADSPLGSAVLGRSPGDRVEVIAPAGPRVVTVQAVE